MACNGKYSFVSNTFVWILPISLFTDRPIFLNTIFLHNKLFKEKRKKIPSIKMFLSKRLDSLLLFLVGVQIVFSHRRSYGTKIMVCVCVTLQVLWRAFDDSINQQQVQQKNTPHTTDERATGAHTHPHGWLLSFLLHCPCLQVQDTAFRKEEIKF